MISLLREAYNIDDSWLDTCTVDKRMGPKKDRMIINEPSNQATKQPTTKKSNNQALHLTVNILTSACRCLEGSVIADCSYRSGDKGGSRYCSLMTM